MIYLVSYATHLGGRNGQMEVEAPSKVRAIQTAILAKHKQLQDKEEFGGIYWESFQVEKKQEEK